MPADVLVVIDEAYREFVRDPEVPDGVEVYRDRPNVAVLRTFSKAYGLAGLRVGFAVAHEPVAAALRKTAVPFGVNTHRPGRGDRLAARRGRAARAGRGAGRASATRVVEALRDRAGTCPRREANFVWLRLGERTVEFAAACEEAGVIVRPFPGEGAARHRRRARGERRAARRRRPLRGGPHVLIFRGIWPNSTTSPTAGQPDLVRIYSGTGSLCANFVWLPLVRTPGRR